MAASLRVGIIGAGWAASGRAAAYARLPGVTVAGLWSRTRARAEKLAGQLEQPGMQVYDRWQDLIAQGDLDVISIVTPAALRREPIALALERGLHVLVEKPFTVALSEARELVQMADRATTVTSVSLNWRYSPGNQVARRAVQEGAIGEVLGISVVWRFRFTGDTQTYYGANPWAKRLETGGGVLRGAGSHDFDRTRFLTGLEFARIVGRTTPSSFPGTDVDERYLLMAELSNGGLADSRLEFTPGQGEWRVVLLGDEGTLTVTHQDVVPHLPTFADGLRVQAFIAAAERSEAERRWVGLAELQQG